jgi:predicted nucleic acid-binding protein
MTADRQFVDTNVLVYAHDVSAGVKRERALALVTSLWESGQGCLSIQVLQEFYVTVTRKVSRPLGLEAAAHVVADLGRWKTHSPQPRDVLEAIRLQDRSRISFWDAMILHSAVSLECPLVWSEDLKPGRSAAGVFIENPFA